MRPRDRVAVVVNGNAKHVTDELVETLDQIVQSGDLFVSRSLEEGREIARTIVERDYPTVLTGGGDGTFVQMVTWVTEEARVLGKKRPRFGFLKLGTGNALAWVLGAQHDRDKGVVADLARLRQEGGSRKLRLLDVEGTLTPFAGLGIDSMGLDDYQKTKEAIGKVPGLKRYAAGPLGYAVTITTRSLPGFLFKPHWPVRIVNDGDDVLVLDANGRPSPRVITRGETVYEGPSRMVSMSTIPYWGYGARIFPFAEEREDRFSLRVVDIGSLDVVRHFGGIWNGTFRKGVSDFLCESVSIHFEQPMPLQVGGDLAGERTVVRVSLAKEPLDVVDYFAPPPV